MEAQASPMLAGMIEGCLGCKIDAARSGTDPQGCTATGCAGAFDESPPRVEYHFTPLGERLVVGLDQLEGIRREFHSGVRDDPGVVPVTGPS